MIKEKDLTLVPGLRYIHSIIDNGPKFGIDRSIWGPAKLEEEIETARDTYRRAKAMGIRLVPGGDFGFAWNPHGEYAKDIQAFVDVIGFTPLEAISCATRDGARLMRRERDFGTLEAGKLADLVVVNGDPLADIAVLQDRSRLSVMKGGLFVTRRF
jgi:imidazolonepropionase-like amidohydrolase